MTDLLDDNIRRLVNEVVDGAPRALQPPVEFNSGPNPKEGRRSILVGAAAILVLFTIVGGVFWAVREPTGEQVELGESVPDGERIQLPSVFDRPRTFADELPANRSWMTGGGILASRGETLTLDLEDSRRWLQVDETTVWVAPFTNRRGACWAAIQPGFDASRGCVHLDNDDLAFGVAMNFGRGQDATGTTTNFITSGLVFRDEIVDVVGGTLEDGFFIHPTETDPIFVFSDGSTARQSDATNDETTVPSTSLLTSDGYRLPSVFDRPRNNNDQLPVPPLQLDLFDTIDADFESSRLGLEAHGVTVWLVPSFDRRQVCRSTVVDDFPVSTFCYNLDRLTGDGIIVSGRHESPGSEASTGVVFNPDVVDVIGGTLKDGVFIHPTEADPVFVFSDGTTKRNSYSAGDPADLVPNSDNQIASFCQMAEQVSGEQPESYVGSREHLADIRALAEVAPGEIAIEVQEYEDYLSSGSIDPSTNPESTVFANWPPNVQSAIAAIQAYIAANC